jgi:hypothetical protein
LPPRASFVGCAITVIEAWYVEAEKADPLPEAMEHVPLSGKN